MIRISCVLTLALALTSCGEQGNTAGERGDTDGQQGDTAGEQGDTAAAGITFEVDGTGTVNFFSGLGDTVGVLRIQFDRRNNDIRISGSCENMSAKSVADELLKRFRGDWAGATNVTDGSSLAPLQGYEVTNKLTDSPGKTFTFKFKFKFTFKKLTLADLKELLERELKATVTLDEKAKTFTVE